MYGCCLGVLQCSAQDNLVSCDDTLASQTRPTCIVPIVFSRLLFKSPPDLQCVNVQYVMIRLFFDYLANQAVLKAVNKSPVPTKAAGNLGIST